MSKTEFKEFIKEHVDAQDSYYLSDSTRVYYANQGSFQTFKCSQGDTVNSAVLALRYYNQCVDDDSIIAYNTNHGLMIIEFQKETVTKASSNNVQTLLTMSPISWYSGYHYVDTGDGDKEIELIPSQPTSGVFKSLCTLPPSKLKFVPEYNSIYYGILLLKDGTVISKHGNYEDLGIILMKDYELPDIPEIPSWEDVLKARKTITDIFRGFNLELEENKEFEEWVSFQNTVFLLFMAILRPTYKGPMPITVVDKNSERLGGSFLLHVIGCLAHAKEPSSVTFNTSSVENEKMVNTKLIDSDMMTIIDNVTQDSEWVFPSILSTTSGGENSVVEVRILGKSETVKVKPVTLWAVNGIDMIVSADVCGRVVVIKMKAKDAWQNMKFDEDKDAYLNRCINMHPEIIRSAAIMIRYWISQGKPPAKDPNGNFSEYSELYNFIGGVMSACGFNHYLDNMKEVQTITNNKDIEGSTVVNILRNKFGDEEFTCQDVYKKLCDEIQKRREDREHNYETELADKVLSPSEIRSINSLNLRTIGKIFAKYVDKHYVGTNYLLHKSRRNHGNVFQVLPKPNCSAEDLIDSSESDTTKQPLKQLKLF